MVGHMIRSCSLHLYNNMTNKCLHHATCIHLKFSIWNTYSLFLSPVKIEYQCAKINPCPIVRIYLISHWATPIGIESDRVVYPNFWQLCVKEILQNNVSFFFLLLNWNKNKIRINNFTVMFSRLTLFNIVINFNI